MYDFIKTDNGWIVCWGPPPVPQTAAPDNTDKTEATEDEPWVVPFKPRVVREPDLAPVA